MPKRKNYANRNTYLQALLRNFRKLNPNNYQSTELFISKLPMGDRLWMYAHSRTAREIITNSNLTVWGKKRGGEPVNARTNMNNMKQAMRNYPQLEATAKKLRNPNFLTRVMISHIEGTRFNDPAFISFYLPEFRSTVRGNAANAAKKLLEIREKAAKRTIARYVRAGKVGFHISHARKLRAMNRARGVGVSPSKKRASSAPPVLTRR